MTKTARCASLRLVLDTNVWLDWLVFADADVIPVRNAVASGLAQIFIDAACDSELVRVLGYARGRLTLDTVQQAACYAECRRVCTQHQNEHGSAARAVELPVCRDPDDQKLLELAHDCQADYLLTRDNALLELARHRTRAPRFCIISPRQFSVALKAPSSEWACNRQAPT